MRINEAFAKLATALCSWRRRHELRSLLTHSYHYGFRRDRSLSPSPLPSHIASFAKASYVYSVAAALVFFGFLFGETTSMAFVLRSSSFRDQGEIPSQYTCEGDDISPPLSWSDPPQGTVTFALIVDDPDAPDPKAPKMTCVHWVLFNIPGSTRDLKQGIASDELPTGTQEGMNDYRRTSYGGPCPPIGRHRYFFKLYALSKEITGLDRPTKRELEKAMEGSIIAKAELVGTYTKTS